MVNGEAKFNLHISMNSSMQKMLRKKTQTNILNGWLAWAWEED